MASSENPNGGYSNGFREGIIEMAIGGVCIAYGEFTTKGVGIGLVVDGGSKFIKATADYIWPERGERGRPRERERDGERPSMADRERDRERDRDRDRDRDR